MRWPLHHNTIAKLGFPWWLLSWLGFWWVIAIAIIFQLMIRCCHAWYCSFNFVYRWTIPTTEFKCFALILTFQKQLVHSVALVPFQDRWRAIMLSWFCVQYPPWWQQVHSFLGPHVASWNWELVSSKDACGLTVQKHFQHWSIYMWSTQTERVREKKFAAALLNKSMILWDWGFIIRSRL